MKSNISNENLSVEPLHPPLSRRLYAALSHWRIYTVPFVNRFVHQLAGCLLCKRFRVGLGRQNSSASHVWPSLPPLPSWRLFEISTAPFSNPSSHFPLSISE